MKVHMELPKGMPTSLCGVWLAFKPKARTRRWSKVTCLRCLKAATLLTSRLEVVV